MTNPQLFTVSVGSTPTLIFSGCGKIRIQNAGPGGIFVGHSSVSSTVNLTTEGDLEFEADAELYAVRAGGFTGDVRVWRWF